MLPHDLPPWEAGYSRFQRWVDAGTWERTNAALRTQVREAAGRSAEPTAGIIDAQSVRTGGNRGSCHGHDAGKQTSGRKRHALVDVLGLLLVLHVQAADVQDRLGAKQVLQTLARPVPTVRKVWADGGYGAPLVKRVCGSGAVRGGNCFPPAGCHGIRAPKTAMGSGTNIRMVGEMPASSGPGF